MVIIYKDIDIIFDTFIRKECLFGLESVRETRECQNVLSILSPRARDIMPVKRA